MSRPRLLQAVFTPPPPPHVVREPAYAHGHDPSPSPSPASTPHSTTPSASDTSDSSENTPPDSPKLPDPPSLPLERKIPDWAKDVRWLVGHQPAAKRAALADPNYVHLTAPAAMNRKTDQFGVYRSRRKRRAATEGRRSYRMSALVEVSEEEDPDVVRKRSTSQQRRRPSVSKEFRTPRYKPPSSAAMAISVVRGVPCRRISLFSGSRSSLSGLDSRNSSMASLGSALGIGSPVPLAVRLAEIDGALGMTPALAPPKIPSSHVLVQVHAVALDALDAIILSKRLAKGGFGFVPGRSFVGRVVDCGFQVANVSRGEWVIGLADIRKCGALAELVLIDKSRVCAIPRPTDRLTTTQCALLPLCAVPAHRAVRTIPNSSLKFGPNGERTSRRVLVLQAHDGAGLLAVQLLRGLGMWVTAQVPVGSEAVAFGLAPSLGLRDRGRSRAAKQDAEREKEREKKLGRVDVVVGDDPIQVIAQLEEAVYDAVVDTVGGRAVWDACRRVMCTDAHFTTLVGDSTDSVPSINAHIRSSFRSLARAFAKTDKALGYQWVSPAADLDHEGEDVRHSLNAVADAAVLAAYGALPARAIDESRTTEGMLPRVTCSFPFDRTSDAFAVDEDGRGPLVRGGTVVVRVL